MTPNNPDNPGGKPRIDPGFEPDSKPGSLPEVPNPGSAPEIDPGIYPGAPPAEPPDFDPEFYALPVYKGVATPHLCWPGC